MDSPWDNVELISGELFSVERLEEHARSLAAAQPVTVRPSRGLPLAGRLADNEQVLLGAYRTISQSIAEGLAITPAAEWLIDNYHLVETQIREIRGDLPPGYYRKLPKLAAGPLTGYPRVLGVMWGFVAHTDSRFDAEVLCRYVRAYQDVQPLTIGELWAVAITLRIVLVENLRRTAERMVRNRAARQEADGLADRLLGVTGDVPESVQAVLAGRDLAALPDAFSVQLIHRLRDQDPRITPALVWLDERLELQNTTTDAVVRDELQRQGASSITVRNIITSMRLISNVDWTELFERISLVDDVLAAGDTFKAMDFPTRNLYRSAVEDLALGARRLELDVARAAVAAAADPASTPDGVTDDRHTDPGYHLLAGGLERFEATLGFTPSLRIRIERASRSLGVAGYGSAIVGVAAALVAAPIAAFSAAGLDMGTLLLFTCLGAIPALELAVALVNRGVMRGFGATLLPALELRDGIPVPLTTLVAVPTLLTTPEAITAQIERLEIHYLTSPEGELYFALLSDWIDAPTERVTGDDTLLAAAADGIARLNRKYRTASGGDRFLLFHRRRLWNASEGRWLGWERKRGKLHEFNRLLRGATDTTFIRGEGTATAAPDAVRYVITLDADTRLPRDTIRRLIGKMAHPLNRPRLDHDAGRVVEGYAVLQPRVTPSVPVDTEGSLFQRIFSSVSGIDPYSSTVSDVYQDLFGEGSYSGKGIYDVDAFEAALAGRIPDNTLLSHDLFEGVFARAGLASDVEVVEEYPARYDVAASRHHRWARGDWQLLPWILWCGPRAADDPTRRAIPTIGRWKMIDNLRRTMSAPAATIALLAGWSLPLRASVVWTSFVVATIVVPTLIPLVAALVPSSSRVSWRSHLRALGDDVRLALTLSALLITFLAHQAWLMADAVTRTLLRLIVTRRHLLEWVTAAEAAIGPGLDLAGFYRRMAGAVVVGGLAVPIVAAGRPGTWMLAAPFAALWLASPAVARFTSRSPAHAANRRVADTNARELRLIARRTWRFFETFVTATDHWLPPDNFQDDPAPVVAHRTSPTNIGLYLLATVSARDFGWLGTGEAVERLEATLATVRGLAQYRGHFYNWYDTRDLRPLEPQYISSVDSGNLCGHLIALANSCREWRDEPLAPSQRLAGISDALALARHEAEPLRGAHRSQTVTWRQRDETLEHLRLGVDQPLADTEEITERLTALEPQSEILTDIARALAPDSGDDGADLVFWAEAVSAGIASHRRDLTAPAHDAPGLAARLTELEREARQLALAMNFGFLLDADRLLLSIGYTVTAGTIDAGCYDLLASEARLASFLAIAKGDVPTRHWFRLGRPTTPVGKSAALLSWSGSMFEYLMPSLVMRAPTGCLLEQTSRLILQRQVEYAATLGVPWGISESAYNVRDLELTYQYSNFGIPGLGLKRGLGDNAVVAPYATALAAMVDPAAAVANFARLLGAGARGRYGFYEALDYTPSRLPDESSVAIVRAFMAHHQGMTIVAIADALLAGTMRARFHAEPMVQATELLLQERMPRDVAVSRPWATDAKSAVTVRDVEPPGTRRLVAAFGATPSTQLLSNGRYAVMLTAAGSGYSRWQDRAVTRWREDATCDDSGSYVYLRDADSGTLWSAGIQPIGAEPDDYAVTFKEDRAEFVRTDGTLTTTLEVLVSVEDDGEVRRVSVANSGRTARVIDVTSYAELVLDWPAADVAHPAFSKLFVATEYLAAGGALLASRRRRTATEAGIWAAHLAVVEGEVIGKPQYETDRARFLGRGASIRRPLAVSDGRPLSNTVGTVLDPVFALRHRIRVAPGATGRVEFWTLAASSRAALLDLVDKHRDATSFGRAAMLAWTQAKVQIAHLGIDAGHASLFQRLAGHVLYAAPTVRPSSETLRRGAGAQSGLWSLGISGDVPIVLLRVADAEDIDLARQLLQAHEYWRIKQLAVDLVILNERATSYAQDLQVALETLVRTSESRPRAAVESTQLGRVFVRRADLMSAATRQLLIAVARAVLVGQRGRLSDQLDRAPEPKIPAPPKLPWGLPVRAAAPAPRAASLEYYNGLGGFADDGREYVTILGPGQSTPTPWINVVANAGFGFQVATEGSGYTWCANSREHQLTQWSNDPVTDRSGEAFYLRDDDTGALWSPTASPIRDDAATYVAHHGRGYSRFTLEKNEVSVDLRQFVPLSDPIKVSRLHVENKSSRTRHLSVVGFVEWVLGRVRAVEAPFVMTELDPDTGALMARNAWNPLFAARIAFIDFGGRQADCTGDRREFIGRNGTLSSPAALASAAPLSNRVGAAIDPCGVLRTRVELAAHASVELVFVLGEAENLDEARRLILRYRTTDLDAVQLAVREYWDGVLGAVQVKTPDRAMDILLNGWLLYQTLACRILARSAFYQASGAYGFRDQLQDGMALAHACPGLTREHLLRAAGRQFIEGDVLHWWLPQSRQGVRTRISDDRAWLAYCVAHYVGATGDRDVLDAVVPFIEGPRLATGEHESFFEATISDEVGDLFEHCARALDQSLSLGAHELPLIGTGDWNDGMNRVGEAGQGESVWLGWFLYATLLAFVPLADARGDSRRAEIWRAHAASLRLALEREAWDGEWYRRGYYDDGAPLGSATSDECRIDSIAQSWAVLSGAAEPERAARAMAAVERELTRPADGVALLFAPPFDHTPREPGYVKGYPPGIRENGGQYTHAVAWSIMALAALGEGDKAAALWALVNPINHTRTRAAVQRYKVEPYVVAADVYATRPHVGRGGWTWYTGSAGWLQRAGIESILGVRIQGADLTVDPRVPKAWRSFEVTLRHRSARYQIRVDFGGAGAGQVLSADCDGATIVARPVSVPLVDDGVTHQVHVQFG